MQRAFSYLIRWWETLCAMSLSMAAAFIVGLVGTKEWLAVGAVFFVVLSISLMVIGHRPRFRKRKRDIRDDMAGRTVAGVLLANGELVLREIETNPKRLDSGLIGDATLFFRHLKLASDASDWAATVDYIVGEVLGKPFRAQLSSRAGLELKRKAPDVGGSLLPYWEGVAWRLERLNEFLNKTI